MEGWFYGGMLGLLFSSLGPSLAADYSFLLANKTSGDDAPKKPVNFSCVSYNWQDLTCSWRLPDNLVNTNYTLYYYLTNKWRMGYSCPNTKITETNQVCYWDQLNFRRHQYYLFEITGTNVNDSIKFNYTVDTFAHVIPAKARDLSVVTVSADSATIRWKTHWLMNAFPPGLDVKIKYRSEWDLPGHWQVTNDTRVKQNGSVRTLNITDLYANSLYNVSVSLKSSTAPEDKWSEPAIITLHTLATVPGGPPEVDVGSFGQILKGSQRRVRVFWRPVPSQLRNGNNFSYRLEVLDDLHNVAVAKESTREHVELTSLNMNQSYTVKIFSQNNLGSSVNYTQIYLPSATKGPSKPRSLEVASLGPDSYMLTWKPPLSQAPVDNYTVFWFMEGFSGDLSCWTHVDGDVKEKVLLVSGPEGQSPCFAVAANTQRGSSGIVSASSYITLDKGSETKFELSNEVVNIASNKPFYG